MKLKLVNGHKHGEPSQDEGFSTLCVSPQQVMGIWGHCAPFIESAYRENDVFMPDHSADLTNGMILLWIVWDGQAVCGAALTKLVKAPSGLVCYILAAGGVGGKILPSYASLLNYAKNEGCVKMRYEGRSGWARVVGDFDRVGVIMEQKV